MNLYASLCLRSAWRNSPRNSTHLLTYKRLILGHCQDVATHAFPSGHILPSGLDISIDKATRQDNISDLNVMTFAKVERVKVLFLDESGDHNLTVIDAQYPIFVLGGVILDEEYAVGSLENALNEFKIDLFGRTDIVLHTADITRNRNGFEGLKDTAFREVFFSRLNKLGRNLSYSVVACAIRKKDYLSDYGLAALDPYLISLDVLVEIFCFEVGNIGGGGVIVAETRDPILDQGLELAWANLQIQGTRRIPGKVVEERIPSLALCDKKDNIAGLQLADLVVSPVGRYVLGKPIKEDWDIVERKFRRSPGGRVENYGMVILPKQ